jgi:hypothetical protein
MARIIWCIKFYTPIGAIIYVADNGQLVEFNEHYPISNLDDN